MFHVVARILQKLVRKMDKDEIIDGSRKTWDKSKQCD